MRRGICASSVGLNCLYGRLHGSGPNLPGMGNIGMQFADNYLRCDSSGSCMMGDKLSLTADASGNVMMGDNLKDNYLRCDASGSCMMDDSLTTKDTGFGISTSVPGMGSISVQFADNFLSCNARAYLSEPDAEASFLKLIIHLSPFFNPSRGTEKLHSVRNRLTSSAPHPVPIALPLLIALHVARDVSEGARNSGRKKLEPQLSIIRAENTDGARNFRAPGEPLFSVIWCANFRNRSGTEVTRFFEKTPIRPLCTPPGAVHRRAALESAGKHSGITQHGPSRRALLQNFHINYLLVLIF